MDALVSKGNKGEQGEQGPPGGGSSGVTYIAQFNNENEISTWVKEANSGTWRIDEGRLILSGNNGGFLMVARSSTTFTSDLDISVETEWMEGVGSAGYGVAFKHGFRSGKAIGYLFGISADQSYVVGRYDGDGNTPVNIIDWKGHTDINERGANTLRVLTTGTLFEFYINGEKVDEVNDNTYAEGLIGLFVQELQEVAFDNLTVREIGGQPLLKPASE